MKVPMKILLSVWSLDGGRGISVSIKYITTAMWKLLDNQKEKFYINHTIELLLNKSGFSVEMEH